MTRRRAWFVVAPSVAAIANGMVELSKGHRVRVVDRGVGHLAGPEHVVHHDQPTRAQQIEAELVLGPEVELVGVQERHVEAALLPSLQQAAQGLRRVAQSQIHAIGDPGLGPVALGEQQTTSARDSPDVEQQKAS